MLAFTQPAFAYKSTQSQLSQSSLEHTWHSAHTKQGTNYSKYGVKNYIFAPKWPHQEAFLVPTLMSYLQQLQNKVILDVGCGGGYWAMIAATNGGKVFGVDIQPQMIEEAKKIIANSNLNHKVILNTGDAADLPYSKNKFDLLLSINVACNLPLESFEAHFYEIERVLKKNGRAIIVVPTSLDIVFTDGTMSKRQITNSINKVLSNINSNFNADSNPLAFQEPLNQLKEVLSATFTQNNNKLELVTNLSQLKEGQAIWRKLPNVIVPDFYHSHSFYLKSFAKVGLTIEKTITPKFGTKKERLKYNSSHQSQLGVEYISHPTYMFFVLNKV